LILFVSIVLIHDVIVDPHTQDYPTKHRWQASPTSAIPFQRPVKQDLKKDNFLMFKLCTNPTQDTSPTYDLSVLFFSHGTVEELFDLVKNI